MPSMRNRPGLLVCWALLLGIVATGAQSLPPYWWSYAGSGGLFASTSMTTMLVAGKSCGGGGQGQTRLAGRYIPPVFDWGTTRPVPPLAQGNPVC